MIPPLRQFPKHMCHNIFRNRPDNFLLNANTAMKIDDATRKNGTLRKSGTMQESETLQWDHQIQTHSRL
jgi:hypothetical protein